jgi:hypothetical protein
MLALLNLASGECAKRNSTGRAGIQNDVIFRHFPGFPFDFAQGGERVEPGMTAFSNYETAS